MPATTPSCTTTASRCPRCQAEVRCGVQNSGAACWCTALPAILPVTETACLCVCCLNVQVQEAIACWLIEHPLPEPVPARFHGTEMVEGIDYTLENGLLVFSAWYHRKRGRCCGNGCRHCPWRQAAQRTPAGQQRQV